MQQGEIRKVLGKLAGRLEIKDADERQQVRPRQAVLQSPGFRALWDRIKYKTTYRVAFDNEDLIAKWRPGFAGGRGYPENTAPVEEGRHRDRPGRRRGDGKGRGGNGGLERGWDRVA